MTEPEIKPCPFCGGECEVTDGPWESHIIGCVQCGYFSNGWEDDEDAGIAAHNVLYERARVGELVTAAVEREGVWISRQQPAEDFVRYGVLGKNYEGVGKTLLSALESLAEKVRGA